MNVGDIMDSILKPLDIIDELTQIYRRESIMQYAESLIKENIPFSFAILDIDNFKLVNDNYGHQIGDEVLKKCAQSFDVIVGDSGYVGRYGGDEFVFIYPNTVEYNDLWQQLYKVLKSSANLEFSNDSIVITYSIGCARYPMNTTNIDDLFNLADKALYRGKVKGRNCFIIYLAEKHADIKLQTFREKIYSPVNLHQKVFTILTSNKGSLLSKIISAINFVGAYLLIDHLALEDNNEMIYEYFQPLYKDRVYSVYKTSMVEPYMTNGIFIENTVSANASLTTPLYNEFRKQGVYASAIFLIKTNGKTYGILRADMASVNTGRMWQNDDLVLLLNLANTIALAKYIDENKN